MKNKKYYGLICLYGIILVVLFLGYNHLYGSNVDWLSQHSIIPEYFRNLFYETKKLIPNFAFNLGAGQNIYNYAYYGFLSPIILVSYFFPFIKMTAYVQVVSIILFLMFGMLMYNFINNNLDNAKLSFISSIFAMTMAPVNFNFHHHIMFVWYFPFLLVALFGIDKYLKIGKSYLLILSVFLLIMTNYYYSVASLIVIYLYGVYKIFEKDDGNFKLIIKKCLLLGIKLVIPILMAMIMILPTFGTLKEMTRESNYSISLLKLIIPNFRELFYNPSSLGLVGVFFIALCGNLFTKKKKISDLFLNGCLLFIICIPLFMFILNGCLYIRGKVLIPFIPLIILSFGKFSEKLFNAEIDLVRLKAFLIILIVFSSIFNFLNIIYGMGILISLYVICIFVRKSDEKRYIYYVFFILFISAFFSNLSEKYVDSEYYKIINNSEVKELYQKLGDREIYRSYNRISPKDDPNKVYGSNYYSPAIYSSTYNSKYWDFYNFNFGNNIMYRNAFITAGTDNELFYTFMGVRYMTSNRKPGVYYERIKNGKNINLYYNKYAYPLCYVPNKIGSLEKYENLDFPYNIEYMMKNSVVNGKDSDNFETIIKEYKSDEIKDKYQFKFKNKHIEEIKLSDEFYGKILYLTFEMKNNQSCIEGDSYITINGVKNKLTCKSGLYHNKNKIFQYVLPITSRDNSLKVEIGKGSYILEKVRVYYSPIIYEKNIGLNDLVIDKKRDMITGNIDLDRDNYLITSIPYDKGFRAFVNDIEVKSEIVNKAFLGFKLKKGYNEILIKYKAPYFDISLIISLVGLGLFFLSFLLEYFFINYDQF